jgi:hypothetical protein
MTTDQRNMAGVVESSLRKTYDGRPVGSIIQTDAGNYLVTENGYIKK